MTKAQELNKAVESALDTLFNGLNLLSANERDELCLDLYVTGALNDNCISFHDVADALLRHPNLCRLARSIAKAQDTVLSERLYLDMGYSTAQDYLVSWLPKATLLQFKTQFSL
jgi:hypothetical protein